MPPISSIDGTAVVTLASRHHLKHTMNKVKKKKDNDGHQTQSKFLRSSMISTTAGFPETDLRAAKSACQVYATIDINTCTEITAVTLACCEL